MLRNWSETIPGGGPNAGALVSGTEYVGLLGTEILAATSSGDNGPGLFVPWGLEGANRYKAMVTALTGGPLRLFEDGSGEADAAFTATLSVYENNLLVASEVFVDGAIGEEPSQTEISIAAAGLLLGVINAQVSAQVVPSVNVSANATGLLVAAISASVSSTYTPFVGVERVTLSSRITREVALVSRIDLEA